MKLSTMAAVMTFVTKLEESSAAFYETQAKTHPARMDTFLSWAKENRKFESTVKRTYFGVITDTLESNFSFQGLDDEDYQLNLPDTVAPQDIEKRARAMEETIRRFYLDAGKRCEGLMADIPRLFNKIARNRERRLTLLD